MVDCCAVFFVVEVEAQQPAGPWFLGSRHRGKLGVQSQIKQESDGGRAKKGEIGACKMSRLTTCKHQRAAQKEAKYHKKVLQECK
jgi:hypothetical protein